MLSWLLMGVLMTSLFYVGFGQNATTDPPPTCKLVLANNQTMLGIRQSFVDASQGQKVVVYFRMRVVDDQTGNVTSFEAGKTFDTFEPDLWLWATSKGKNLLRVPLDFKVLSLGLLGINLAKINIDIEKTSADCLVASPSDDVIHTLASFLANNVTVNGSALSPDGPVICRSAFAFSHNLFGMRGIGYRCCVLSPSSTANNPVYECKTSFTDSWELIWYGPVALLGWVYAIAFIHFYKLYHHAFVQTKIRRLAGIHDTIDDIKQDIVNRIVKISKRIARIADIDDLISLREDCGYLDVLGVDKTNQSKIGNVLTFIVVLILFSTYYVVYALFVYEYHLQVDEQTIRRLNDTQTVFLNVIGHFGWLLCQPELYIFRYAVFEAVYTLLIPLLAGILYWSIKLRAEAKQLEQASSSQLPATVERVQAIRQSAIRGRVLKFVDSMPGKVLMVICFLILIIFVIFLAGPFVAYLVYFVGLGVFANIDVVSPWIIPLIICVHFFTTSFDPVTNLYKRIKDMFFGICLQRFKEIVIRRNNEIFLPRQLIETFYVPRSRPVIYSSVLRIMWVVAFVILLILVILTIQYPYYHQTDSIVSFLGVQVVFILPLLAQLMNTGQTISPLEQQILSSDIVDFIQHFKEQHPPSVRTDSEDSNHHGDDDDSGGEVAGNTNGGYGDENGGHGSFGDVVANTGQVILNNMYINPYKLG